MTYHVGMRARQHRELFVLVLVLAGVAVGAALTPRFPTAQPKYPDFVEYAIQGIDYSTGVGFGGTTLHLKGGKYNLSYWSCTSNSSVSGSYFVSGDELHCTRWFRSDVVFQIVTCLSWRSVHTVYALRNEHGGILEQTSVENRTKRSM